MTRYFIYLTLFCLLSSTGALYPQALPGSSPFVSDRTAFTLPMGQLEFGLLQPMRYGLSNRIELSAHPVLIFADPHLMAKIRWMQTSRIQLSSEHRVACPTPLMRLITTSGAGGLISPQFTIPLMASVYNGLIATWSFNDQSFVTAKTGIIFALGTGKLDRLSSIDLPVIYPREAVFYHQPVIRLAFDYRCPVSKKVACLLTSDYYIDPGTRENFFFEHRMNLMWKPGIHFMLQGGYRLCYGNYPFGNQWHLLPDIDVAFHLGTKPGNRQE